MATVPKIDIGNLTQVRDVGNAYQSAEGATPDAFGAGIGRALISSGRSLAQQSDKWAATAIKEQQENNITSAKDLHTEAMRRVRVESYGGLLDESDPSSHRKGYYNLTNQEAIGETGKFQAAVRKHYADVYNLAPNDAVKRLIGNQFDNSVGAEIEASFKFHDQQNKNYQKIVRAARLDEAQQGGILGNEQNYLDARAVVVGEVEEDARANGITDRAYIANQVQSAITDMAVKRVQRLINQGNFEEANKFFKERVAAKDIDPDEAVDLIAKLQTGVDQQAAFAAADRLLGENNRNIINSEGSIDAEKLKGVQEALKDLPASQRKLVAPLIKAAQAQVASLQKAKVNEALKRATKQITEGKSYRNWIKDNPDDFAILATQFGVLSNLERAAIKTVEGTKFAEADSDLGRTLLSMTNAEWEEAFLTDSSIQVGNKTYHSSEVSKRQWDQIRNLKRTADNKAERRGESDAAYTRAENAIRDIAPTNTRKGFRDGATPGQAQAANRIKARVESWITAFEAEHNKWPSEVEIRQHVRGLYLKAGVEDNVWGFTSADWSFRADDIKPAVGVLLEYSSMTDDQRDGLEVDLEFAEKQMPSIRGAIAAIRNAVYDGGSLSWAADQYIKDYGKDRLVSHLIALKMVMDQAVDPKIKADAKRRLLSFSKPAGGSR
jgi:hypothetical protein